MVTAAALTAPMPATSARWRLPRKASPARDSIGVLRAGLMRRVDGGAAVASLAPPSANKAQRTSCPTISQRRVGAPMVLAYLPTSRPQMTLASGPPPPMRPESRLASPACDTPLHTRHD